ncbi:MAG: peptide chain release factor N(5)-glutamine methyltransferase [Chakrabartia sp.]
MTVRDALRAATARLTDSDTPRLDAELLMAHALGVSRDILLMQHLDAPVPVQFDTLLSRRIAHEPLAYITGTRDFWTITLNVAPGVLIPRPDSETLIEAAIAHFGAAGPKRVLDLGTGSGALLLAALDHWPSATGVGIDASETALEIARRNADVIAPGRATLCHGDWASGLTERFDLILCNPPYVETAAQLSPDVLNEPRSALFAGVDGLDDYRRIIPYLSALIAPEGLIAMEIGYEQATLVQALFAEQGMATVLAKDLGGRDRALLHFALGKPA